MGGNLLISTDTLKLLNDSDNIVFIEDQSDLENDFGAARAADIQDFIIDNQDKNIITGQSNLSLIHI